MRVLVLNAGSSTLKWTLLEGRDRTTIQSGEQEWSARDDRAQQVRATLREVSAFDAVGHRVVHGGTRFRHPVVIDRDAGMPEAAAGYGLPYEWSERWALRRFGFHGLSVGYALARTRALLGLVAATLEFTGLRLSSAADQPSVPDRVISASDSAVAVLVVHAREDLTVLDEVLRLADVTSVPG